MPLKGYTSICEEKQKIIVSKDHKQARKHIAKNMKPCKVTQYQIDGIVITTGQRCDFLVMNDDSLNAYLIELKGNDIEHAIDQLEETAKKLQKELGGYSVKYRLVFSAARTHSIKGTRFKKFQKAHSQEGEFVYHENKLEESI